MITHLSIQNYALIEDIKVDFTHGFSVITGETGAGKSILLGALGLLMGNRADSSSVKNTEKKCIIEGVFEIQNYDLNTFFEENDLDYETNTVIRREILPSGKSRAFINDTPTNLSILASLSEKIIDIHSQHQTLEVFSIEFQYKTIDALANNKQLLSNFQQSLKSYKTLQQQLQELLNKKQEAQKELDYNNFMHEELHNANLNPNELQTLETTYEELANVDAINENLLAINQLFENEEIGLLYQLNEIKLRFQKLKNLSQTYTAYHSRLESVIIELNDLQSELNQQHQSLEANPQQLEEINERLSLINKLLTKHQVGSVSELIEIKQSLSNKIESTLNLDQDIEAISKKIDKEKSQLDTYAQQLIESRNKVVPSLINQLETTLKLLGMPHASFKINVSPSNHYTPFGKDNLLFLFTANKGMPHNELKKAASGGELSRIMLSIKSILAKHSNLPTIIFDEIDSGVSGEVANKIADIIKSMSQTMQVICISHLPQIAAKAHTHFKVFKQEKNNKTVTQLKQLTYDNRVTELAEMLGGHNKSDVALAHARELLN